MSAVWVAAAIANVACRGRTTRMTRPCADRTFRRRVSTTPATKLARAPHPRAGGRRQASQRRSPSSRSCAQSFRRTSPYRLATGEGAFQRLNVAGLALVIGGEDRLNEVLFAVVIARVRRLSRRLGSAEGAPRLRWRGFAPNYQLPRELFRREPARLAPRTIRAAQAKPVRHALRHVSGSPA